MKMSRPIAGVALLLVVALAFGCAGPTGSGGRGALAAPTAGAPPDLQRVNTLLADLAARVKPGLVHVTVRRVMGSETKRSEERRVGEEGKTRVGAYHPTRSHRERDEA